MEEKQKASFNPLELSGMDELIPKTPLPNRKHRYGKLVVCEGCRAKNVTLYNVGKQKLCKACRKKEMEN